MPSAVPLPEALQGRAFTVGEAYASGLGDNRLRRADLDAPFHGVRVPTGSTELVDRCRAAMTFLPAGSAVSHWTALRLHGVDLPSWLALDEQVHVLLPPGSGRVRRRGAATHHSERAVSVTTVAGVPTVRPAQAWTVCASTVTGDELVVLGDGLLRRRSPLSSVAALTAEVLSLPPGARGRRRLLMALPDVRARTDSPMETRTRLHLVRAGLPCPAVNEPVHDDAGRFLAMPDLLYRGARIAIEYDGDIHRTERSLWHRDVERRERLQAAGWLVIVVTADSLTTPAVLTRRVRAALRART